MDRDQIQSLQKPIPNNQLDEQVLQAAKEYAKKIGIGHYTKRRKTLQRPLYRLIIARSDSIMPARYDSFGIMYAPYGTKPSLTTKAMTEQKYGNHTYIQEIAALSNGYYNRKNDEDIINYLGLMFHEGFHLRPRQNIFHEYLEESCAEVVLTQGLLSFCKEYGNPDYITKAENFITSERKNESLVNNWS